VNDRLGAPARWGFLGAGFVASKALAPAVHSSPGAVLQMVASRDAARSAALGPVRTAGSYAEVCGADDVDVVYISLTNDDHLPWVLTALDAGKHVVCEKPLALGAAQGTVMREAADRRGLLLVEATWNQWHPRTARLRELVNVMGEPRTAEAWFTFDGVPADNYRMDPARGGGARLDVGPYVVSAALLALGGSPTVESAVCHVDVTGVDLTTAATLVRGANRAEVRMSFEEPESQGMRISSPDLVVELGPPAFTSWRQPATLVVTDSDGTREELFAACDAYELMVGAVSARIRGDSDAWVLPLEESVAVAEVLDSVALAASAR
jgi:predicted dehydrogenase